MASHAAGLGAGTTLGGATAPTTHGPPQGAGDDRALQHGGLQIVLTGRDIPMTGIRATEGAGGIAHQEDRTGHLLSVGHRKQGGGGRGGTADIVRGGAILDQPLRS